MTSASPVFVAKFSDGTVTRMSTHTSLTKLDLKRGVALAIAAYSSRKKRKPPAILEGAFVEAGTDKVLKSYDAAELKKVAP